VKSSLGEKWSQKKKKPKYIGQHKKEMDCDEPHLVPNEKMQPI
jgi:hypothetical protein